VLDGSVCFRIRESTVSIVNTFRCQRALGSWVKGQKKNLLLHSIVTKTVTVGARDRFSEATAGKYINVVGFPVRSVARDGNCLFRSLSTLLQTEGRCNTLRQKASQ
jgi:hypothetical protein